MSKLREAAENALRELDKLIERASDDVDFKAARHASCDLHVALADKRPPPTDDTLEAMMLAMLDATDNADGYAAALQYGIGPQGKAEMRAVFDVVMARTAGMQEDAARYRWLRRQNNGRLVAPQTWWECGCKPVELDAAIDDAIDAEDR